MRPAVFIFGSFDLWTSYIGWSCCNMNCTILAIAWKQSPWKNKSCLKLVNRTRKILKYELMFLYLPRTRLWTVLNTLLFKGSWIQMSSGYPRSAINLSFSLSLGLIVDLKIDDSGKSPGLNGPLTEVNRLLEILTDISYRNPGPFNFCE